MWFHFRTLSAYLPQDEVISELFQYTLVYWSLWKHLNEPELSQQGAGWRMLVSHTNGKVFQQERTRYLLCDTTFLLCYTYKKGFWFIMESLSRIHWSHVAWLLRIWGKLKENIWLKHGIAVVCSWNKNKNILLLNENIFNYRRNHTEFVMPVWSLVSTEMY